MRHSLKGFHVYILDGFQGGLLLDHFYSHWHLIRDRATQLLFELHASSQPQDESLANLR